MRGELDASAPKSCQLSGISFKPGNLARMFSDNFPAKAPFFIHPNEMAYNLHKSKARQFFLIARNEQ